MTVAKEKVSTVGIRNQVTLPKVIRDKIKIKQKTPAFIRAVEKENVLVISLDTPPSGTTYNRIKISEKGQLVIPKNLRESKGIIEGINLVFSINKEKEIRVQKLLEQRKEAEISWRWNFLVEIIGALEGISGLKNLEIKNGTIILAMKKDQAKVDSELLETLKKIENLLGTRLMVEKIAGNSLKLTQLA